MFIQCQRQRLPTVPSERHQSGIRFLSRQPESQPESFPSTDTALRAAAFQESAVRAQSRDSPLSLRSGEICARRLQSGKRDSIASLPLIEGARTTLAFSEPSFRNGQPKLLAQDVQQSCHGINLKQSPRLTIYGERKLRFQDILGVVGHSSHELNKRPLRSLYSGKSGTESKRVASASFSASWRR